MSTPLLAQLPAVRQRLGLQELEVQHDPLLLAMLEAVTARFDLECSRAFLRQADATAEFEADALELTVPAFPIESVARFDLKRNETEGWVVQTGVEFLIRHRCVISLGRRLGSASEQARVAYAGGYVAPGDSVSPGQTALPRKIENAAVEQVAFWFMNRERIGLSRAWDYHGTYRQFAALDLAPSVVAVLEKYRRWVI
jgi:hypothetical protein